MILRTLLLAALLSQATAFNAFRSLRRLFGKEAGSPVILIPGDAGSQLEANLTGKPSVVHYVCAKQTSQFFDLWLNLQSFTPVAMDCWVDNMKLVYNVTARRSGNSPGVDVRVPGFGATETIEWLDPSNTTFGAYFNVLVDTLVKLGYKRGKSIVGAPYDWRRSPVENENWFILLKGIIEITYKYNGNRKVVIVGHSMGNPIMLYFYKNFVDQAWKDKHIRSHVSLAAAWGGSMQIIRLYASGYNMNYYRIVAPPSTLRIMQRSFTSSAFLFPAKAVWGSNAVIATTAEHNYTLNDVKQFFFDMNYPTGWEQYKNHAELLGNLEAPGVEVHCVYGSGVPTAEQFKWGAGYFPDYQPEVTYGDGDGTVNMISSKVCEKWNESNNQGKKVFVTNIPNAEHMAIMSNPQAMDIVRKVVYDAT